MTKARKKMNVSKVNTTNDDIRLPEQSLSFLDGNNMHQASRLSLTWGRNNYNRTFAQATAGPMRNSVDERQNLNST